MLSDLRRPRDDTEIQVVLPCGERDYRLADQHQHDCLHPGECRIVQAGGGATTGLLKQVRFLGGTSSRDPIELFALTRDANDDRVGRPLATRRAAPPEWT